MEMKRGRLDRGVLTHTYRGVASDAEYEVVLREMSQALREARLSGQKIALLAIADASASMSSKQRGRTAEWIKENAALMRLGAVCQAVVVPGAMQRGVLTAILWMIEYPVPIRAFSSLDEAETWTRDRKSTRLNSS